MAMTDHEPVGESVEKVVLVVFNSRRRPVKFSSSTDPSEENKNLKDAVREAFKDVLEADEGSSGSTAWYLQCDSREWGGLVDVCGSIEDRSTVYLQRDGLKEKVTGAENLIR